MAEIRIYITEVKEGDVCPFEENCEELCKCCNVLPTRQEAINRMAKAIFNYYTDGTEPQNWELKEVKDNFNKAAEAALNALLEDKK